MPFDRSRYEQGNADVLLWQTGYRIALALLAGAVAVALRTLGGIELSTIADRALGSDAADWMIGLVSTSYVVLVLVIRHVLRKRRRASQTMATLMVVADIAVIFWLIFLLSSPFNYDRALLLSLFSLQLTHVYFGRNPALLMIAAIASAYLLINDVAIRADATVTWPHVFGTLAMFMLGALMVILVQSNLHRRLATLVAIFERAEEGDFSYAYDVSGDKRPDAITMVGRAYNRMRAQLATIVLTDPLSGCLNRRGFEQQYRRELARAARTRTEVSLIALDLDFFKQVNDTHGHLTGDRVIAETGELLRATARSGDVVARTGGEEFMVLAPETGLHGAQHLAQRIVEAFRRRIFVESSSRIRLTVSIGVVSDLVPDVAIAEDLRARADEALYAAKRAGRDRVVVWTHGLDVLRLSGTDNLALSRE